MAGAAVFLPLAGAAIGAVLGEALANAPGELAIWLLFDFVEAGAAGGAEAGHRFSRRLFRCRDRASQRVREGPPGIGLWVPWVAQCDRIVSKRRDGARRRFS